MGTSVLDADGSESKPQVEQDAGLLVLAFEPTPAVALWGRPTGDEISWESRKNAWSHKKKAKEREERKAFLEAQRKAQQERGRELARQKKELRKNVAQRVEEHKEEIDHSEDHHDHPINKLSSMLHHAMSKEQEAALKAYLDAKSKAAKAAKA